MCNLAPHCKDKKNNPVTEQNRPKDRNIKHGKEGHNKCDDECLCEGVPECNGRNSRLLACIDVSKMDPQKQP